jgi:L-amino acid N-acyltransferase YncA
VDVRVRLATQEDAAAIRAIYAPYVEGSAISFEEDVPSVEEMAGRMESGYPWVVAEPDGAVVGYAYGSVHRARPAYRWSVEVSAYVHQDWHGRGIGRLLYAELFERLREGGFVTAFAGIALPNEASVRFHESMGFEPIGVFRNIGFKLGRWHDVGWWQRPLRELPEEPGRLLAGSGNSAPSEGEQAEAEGGEG